jgi:hypothetical protein
VLLVVSGSKLQEIGFVKSVGFPPVNVAGVWTVKRICSSVPIVF